MDETSGIKGSAKKIEPGFVGDQVTPKAKPTSKSRSKSSSSAGQIDPSTGQSVLSADSMSQSTGASASAGSAPELASLSIEQPALPEQLSLTRTAKPASRKKEVPDGLTERYDSLLKKVREAALEVDESLLLQLLTSTSTIALEAEWVARRTLFPDSHHEFLKSLFERKSLTNEELIILLSALPGNFIPADRLVDIADALALQIYPKRSKQVSAINQLIFSRENARAWLQLSRAQIYAEIDIRTAEFARCGIEIIDNWVDNYRLEQRLPLERCLVLLSIPKETWVPLPRKEYITEILKFGERRIMSAINQGPLVSLLVSRNSTTLDVHEFGSIEQSAEDLLNQLLLQNSDQIKIAPEVFDFSATLERRVRGLVQKTTGFRRDTGKHGLFLGFPIITMRSNAPDGTKGKLRTAPVLLFPIRIDAQIGARGKVTISSCPDSDEVRLNPALSGILELTMEEEEQWNQALEEILNQSASLTAKKVMDLFSRFCDVTDEYLVPIPGKETVCELDKTYLSFSAAFFHCDFAGKAVADDLRNIAGKPIGGTALELALRLAKDDEAESTTAPLEEVLESTGEKNDFAVVAADPSQELAVQQARESRGLHVEGPPGTGKSQTIVNIIADCVARQETVLVVCQKQAALTVVEKRLKAEGLGRRLFYITDVSRDRQPVIRALREQLDERATGGASPVPQLQKERELVTNRIEAIESELNKHHEALYRMHERSGLSFRNLLAELIQIESAEPSLLRVPRLRLILKDLDARAVSALIAECSPLAKLWLASRFENSPLEDLKLFSPDQADAELLSNELERFIQTEEQRLAILNDFPRSADVDDVTIYVNWLKDNEDYIRDIQKEVRLNLSRWVSNFFPDETTMLSAGAESISLLKQISEALSNLNRSHHSEQLFATLANLTDDILDNKIAIAKSATKTGNFFVHINPVRAFNRYRLKKYLKSLGQPTNISTMHEFLKAAVLEGDLRPQRKIFDLVSKTLTLESNGQLFDLRRLQNAVSDLISQLTPVAELAARLRACPLATDAKAFAGKTNITAYDDFNTVLRGVIKRHASKAESLNRLNRLSEWFCDEWIQAQKKVISAARENLESLRNLQRYMHTVIPYQEFRLRAKSLNPKSLELLADLREYEGELRLESDLAKAIGLIIRRESCTAWKGQMETEDPALTIAKEEIDFKVKNLSEADEQLRRLNRKILSEPAPDAIIAGPKKWEDITRLSGARAKRLRELLSNGIEMGLTKLRPVWLMNPETASRILPLVPGLFDAVIFDEASQLLVEYAYPALYRAKRAIVSGDEKQMPPSTFFAAKVQSNDSQDMDEEELDDMLTEAERERIEESWNRREIKDCPDLLNLASAVLPSRSLQIHYRSTYRELISFSNTAFYSRTLSVPSKRPVSDVTKSRPIEVINVDSVYEKQVNIGEAWKVAEILRRLWSVPQAERPTIGVISFNLKQSNLIAEVLNELASKDSNFKLAYEEESKRREDGEDVGFFVKNLENVQGDERDIIIFSTTFGKDQHGVFRRNFGKLGQVGGERRLNVAVTRAKNKIILVTSLPIEKISDFLSRSEGPTIARDYFQAYMSYAEKVSSGALAAAEKSLERLSSGEASWMPNDVVAEDPFVTDVASYLRSLGYEPITSNPQDNDAFNVDIALVNPATGLYGIGIECDAPRHRLLKTARHREIWRPSVLGKSVGKIYRINAREWYQKNYQEKELLRQAIAEAFGRGKDGEYVW